VGHINRRHLGSVLGKYTPTDVGASILNVNTRMKYFYWEELLYTLTLGFIKASILFFYLRIFPGQGIRIRVYVLMGLSFVFVSVYSLVLAFQCNPIRGAWLSWTGLHEAKCMRISLIGWSGAVVNIVMDCATILVPVPELFRLNMKWRKKIEILLMFTVGLL
jgi:hypothetical protein